jgi:uncharacterized Zn finger protein
MANPPTPTTFTPSPLTVGTILHYGLEDLTITGLLVDSYKRSAKYAKVEEIEGQTGIVEGIRMSDYRADVSVSGRVLTATAPNAKVGDILAINGDNILIMSIDLSASSSGFATIDMSGTSYEGVTGLDPA